VRGTSSGQKDGFSNGGGRKRPNTGGRYTDLRRHCLEKAKQERGKGFLGQQGGEKGLAANSTGGRGGVQDEER